MKISTTLRLFALCITTTYVQAQSPALFTPSQTPSVGDFGGYSRASIGTPDGGFILCDNYEPEIHPGQLGMRITKLMSDGRVLWSRMFEIDDGDPGLPDNNGIDGIRPVAIVRNADGNYAVACELVKLENEHYGTMAIVVLIIDPVGYEITHHTYRMEFLTKPSDGRIVRKQSDTSHDADEAPDEIVDDQFVDEGYDNLGVMSFAASPASLVLLIESEGHPTIARLTHDGALVAAHHLIYSPGNTSEDWDAYALRIDSSGRLMVLGSHDDRDRFRTTTTITLFDADGRLLRSRTLPLAIDLKQPESLILADGALLLSGSAIDPDDRQDVPSISRRRERTPMEIDSNAYIERQTMIRIDSGLAVGSITYLHSVMNEPIVDRVAMLATGEIMILHMALTELFDDIRFEEWYTVHETDGTLLFGEVLGPIESNPTVSSYEPMRDHGVSVGEFVAGPSGGVLIDGNDQQGNPLLCVHRPASTAPLHRLAECHRRHDRARDNAHRFSARGGAIRTDARTAGTPLRDHSA